MSRSELSALYRRYGPLIYSRYRRSGKDERAAADATVVAFRQLLTSAPVMSDRAVVEFLASMPR